MRSKTRVIAGLASLLACAAMVGTGFASWVILSSTTKEATGNVTAEAISDTGLSMEVSPAENNSVIFGAPAAQEKDNAWLVSDKSVTESLKVVLTLTIDGPVKNIDVKIDLPAGVNSAITAGYIGAPTAAVICEKSEVKFESDTITLSPSSDSYTGKIVIQGDGYDFSGTDDKVTFTLNFHWGTMFGGENPYDYFNDGTKTVNGTASGWESKTDYGVPSTGTGADQAVTWGDVAKGALGWMHTNVKDSETYKVTFTATSVNLKKA